MKIRKNVVAWIGIILCVLAAGIILATPVSNLFALLPAALFIPFVITLCKADHNVEEVEEETPKKKINWPLVIAWTLVALAAVCAILILIFFGWWFLLPLAIMFGLLIWLAYLLEWHAVWSYLFVVLAIIAIILFGVYGIVSSNGGVQNNAEVDTLHVNNLVVEEDLAVNGDLIVEDDVMVNGDVAVNNDIVVNGDEVIKGDQTVEGNQTIKENQTVEGNANVQGDLNVDGDVNVVGDVNENVQPTEPPTTEPPATEPPATEPPATEPPATEPPATEPPATEPPATEPPATEPAVTPSFTLTASGEGWWEVKFEGMCSTDIVLDNASKGSIEWLSGNTLKIVKTCEGTCYFSLTDNASGEVIYLF